ncbi:PTS sugar transporter subunit IIA [Irregularibacter muris]|uniref:PTS sugar transporter subunit IIA n=1 Tax=Irregularibacter muris TaxID=1796619 RepID=A0AAE3HF91_9FIRM|nr:PTS sugar transporter subunit IIA [Irregularibacter muris]MCR1898432.1 PTS sugar transporter subunit IIA [Irregularibacter muris]
MTISKVISEDCIILNLKVHSKEEVIKKLSERLIKKGAVVDKDRFIQDIYKRENMGPTFAGDYLAMPHGHSHCVVNPAIAIARTTDEISWDNNKNLVRLIILLAIPKDLKREIDIEILKNVTASLGNIRLIKDLLHASTKEEILKHIYSTAK